MDTDAMMGDLGKAPELLEPTEDCKRIELSDADKEFIAFCGAVLTKQQIALATTIINTGKLGKAKPSNEVKIAHPPHVLID